MKNEKYLLLITILTVFGISSCAVSEAAKNGEPSAAKPASEASKTVAKATPDKKSATNSNDPTKEDIKNGSVKADDYEDRTKSTACDVEAFVVDLDESGTNIRREGRANAEIVGHIPFGTDKTVVHIIGTSFDGWLKINHASNTKRDVFFEKNEGFVSGSLLATFTTGYGTRGVKLYDAGRGTKVLTTVPPETTVKIVSCDKDWVRVNYKDFTGWLEPSSQCPNPSVKCN